MSALAKFTWPENLQGAEGKRLVLRGVAIAVLIHGKPVVLVAADAGGLLEAAGAMSVTVDLGAKAGAELKLEVVR